MSTFTKANMPSFLAYKNPRCQQGGLDLQRLVMFHQSGEYDYPCNGHEGTPKGRRQGRLATIGLWSR